MVPIKDFKSCLKAIEEGNFKAIDLPVFIKKLQDGIEKLGDHLQFALHKYCKDSQSEEADEIVIKLSRLCFSEESASGFLNIERFLGSLFHITNYFLKTAEYEVALEISKSIEIKKTEIEKSATENNLTRSFLYLLHSHCISTAQKILDNINNKMNTRELRISEELASVSIKFLQLIHSKQLELGRKVFRNFRCYLNASAEYCDRKNLYMIYKNLETTLLNLVPSYQEDDFLLYYIVKMYQIEGQSEMSLDSVNNHFRKHLELITVFTSDPGSRKYLNLVFSGDLKDFVSGFQKVVLHSKSKVTVLALSVYFNVLSQLWVRTYGDLWSDKFTAGFVYMLYNSVIISLMHCLRNCFEYCRLMDYQMNTCFSDILLLNCLRMMMMIRLCLKYNQLDSLDILNISCQCFKIVQKTLNDMKNQCCLYQKRALWNTLIIHYTNTIEGLLKHSEIDGVWLYMKNCSEDLIYEIINSGFDLPYEWRRVKVLFQRWHYACMKLSEYDEALFVSALYAVSYPQEEEDAMSLWIQTKTTVKNDYTTLKDVIDKERERIKCMNPKCTEDLKALLMMELRVYGSYAASNCYRSHSLSNSIKNVWASLKKLDLKLWERADALNYVIMSTVSSADSEYLKTIKKECEEVIADILKLKKNINCRRLVFGGNLKYSLFLCQLRSVQDIEDKTNDSKSILEYLKKEDAEKVKMGEEVDMNLTCNVMPSSNRFTVTFEETYLKALNETYNMWEEAADMVVPTSLESNEFTSWLNNIKQISQMYYLIGDVQYSILSWMLYYRVAKVCGDRPSALLALSQIIPHCGALDDSQVLQEAEEIAEDILAKDKKKDVVFCYWLGLGSNYLKKMNEEKCYYYLCKLKEMLATLKSTPNFTLYNARYWCLVSKFLCLYSKRYFTEFGFRPETQLTSIVYKAYSYANTTIKDGCMDECGSTEFREILLTVLEVNVWASQVYSAYYQAGYVRLFLDDLYQIFQKLVLPTRTAYILVLLAEVDLMCKKCEDANMKLMSLKSILGSSSNKLRFQEDYVEEKPALLQVPMNIEEEKEFPRALSPARFLDIHDASKERDPSPFRFFLKNVDVVKQFRHIPSCSCYSCHSLMIKFLHINALLIEAQLHQLSGQIRQSSVCYRECYKKQKKLECYQLELNEKLFGDVSRSETGFDLDLDFQSFVVRNCSVKVLLNYSLFMLSPTQKEDFRDEVQKFVTKIDTDLNGLSFEQKLLQWRIMELKLMLFTINELKNAKKEEKMIPQRIELSPPPNSAKTPMVKKNPVANAPPVKYKHTKAAKSPNAFVLKPSGRKVFSDDEDGKPKTIDVAVKKKTPKQTSRKKREPRKGCYKTNVEALADVELLS